MEEEKDEPFKLTFIQGKAFCFNSNDYFKIRYNHRVIGNLIGPGLGNLGNKDYKGFPAVFTDIEAQFLSEKGIIKVFEKPSLLWEPSQIIINEYTAAYEKQGEEMKILEDEKKIKIFKEKVQQIYEGQEKTRKRKKNKNEEFKMKSIEELITDHEKKLEHTPLRNRLVHLPTAHPFDVGQTCTREIKAINQFKYRVYEDLYERGHTITSGETFSGDFLCYPGDPLHYHASHIVVIIEKAKTLTETEMIVHGRTAVSVKKKCVFVQEGNDNKIKYRTMNWVMPKEKEDEKMTDIEYN